MEEILKGSVEKTILEAGDSRIYHKPSDGSVCVLKIRDTGSLDDLISMEDNYTSILTGKSEITFTVGETDSEMDRLVEVAVRQMKDKEKSLIAIYVPALKQPTEKFKITFEATLIKHTRFKPIWEWTPEEKYNIAMRYKNVGVELFKLSESGKQPRYKDAFYRFSRACKILITLEPINDLELDKKLLEDIKTLRMKLYNNMAACQGKHHNFYHVIELCNKVLSVDEKNTQMLFRRGYAYGELRDYERAVQDLTTLKSIDPTHNLGAQKLRHYEWCLKKSNFHCNEMVKRMFKIN